MAFHFAEIAAESVLGVKGEVNPGSSVPTHHPPDELLLDHVTGSNTPQEALLLAAHLELCPRCHRAAAEIAAAGGALLQSIPPAALPPSLFAETIRAIDHDGGDHDGGAAPPRRPPRPPAPPAFAARWPRALRRVVTEDAPGHWRWMPSGFRALRLPFDDGEGRVWVLKAPSLRGPLRHGHAAEEWTVVLEGGYRDEVGTYNPGDFALAPAGSAHRIVSKRDEGCVTLLLVRAEPRYTTLLGKLLSPLIWV